MEAPLRAIAYAGVILLMASVVVDCADDLLWGNRWEAPIALLAGIVTASLTALVTYRRRRNGNDKAAKEEG